MKLGFALPALVVAMALVTGAAAVAAPRAGEASAVRVWRPAVTAPAQFDLSLAEVRFGGAAHVARSGASASIRVSVRGPTGLYYVAGAVTSFSVRGRPRALVLVVNRRPRGSLAPDLGRIGLAVTSDRRLGAPVLAQAFDPFTRPRPRAMPALCDLPVRGVALAGGDLRAVLARGPALNGFTAAAAIAQAYDELCGRARDPAFGQAVTQGSGASCNVAQPSIVPCCPPNAMCVPPCWQCPCAPGPCPLLAGSVRRAIVVCPPARPPLACPL